MVYKKDTNLFFDLWHFLLNETYVYWRYMYVGTNMYYVIFWRLTKKSIYLFQKYDIFLEIGQLGGFNTENMKY